MPANTMRSWCSGFSLWKVGGIRFTDQVTPLRGLERIGFSDTKAGPGRWLTGPTPRQLTETQGEITMRLLTGATGVAGSFVVNEFVQRREPVRILVRNRAKAAALEKVPTVEIVEGDMSRRNTLGPALDGVDRVLMISAPSMDMVQTQSTFVDAV